MASTKTDRLREALADEIVTGSLPAGARLDEMGLAARFGVSRTPVREALKELAASGLVRIVAHRGAEVAPLSDDRVSQMFAAVAEVEAACAGLCVVTMSATERYELAALHDTCGEMVRKGDAERYHIANVAFHHAIHEGCHNRILVEIATSLRRRLAPLSRAQFRGDGRLALSFAEHDVIVQAILRGDRQRALEAMREHLAVVERAFLGYTAVSTVRAAE